VCCVCLCSGNSLRALPVQLGLIETLVSVDARDNAIDRFDARLALLWSDASPLRTLLLSGNPVAEQLDWSSSGLDHVPSIVLQLTQVGH
jgi:hypothetical protein